MPKKVVSQRLLQVAVSIVLCIYVMSSHAQTDDARIWTKLAVEKNFNRQLSFEVNGGLRFGQNYSVLEIYYLEGGFNYRFNKHWSGELHYRYSGRKSNSDRFEIRNRVQIAISYRFKLWDVMINKLRVQYQRQYTDLFVSEGGWNPSNYIRGKYTIAIDLNRKYRPYVATELFYQIKYNKSEFNRVRYEAGIKYEINKHHSYELFYMIQREFNEPNPARSYIIGLHYKINI